VLEGFGFTKIAKLLSCNFTTQKSQLSWHYLASDVLQALLTNSLTVSIVGYFYYSICTDYSDTITGKLLGIVQKVTSHVCRYIWCVHVWSSPKDA